MYLFLILLILVILILVILGMHTSKKTEQFSIKKNFISNKANKYSNNIKDENYTMKCVVYAPSTQTNFIEYLAQNLYISNIITHLHIMVNLGNVPFQNSINNAIDFLENPSTGLFTALLNQVYTLEQQTLTQLQILQNNGVKLILSIQPYPECYYGYRTLPADTNSNLPSPYTNNISSTPSYICPNISQTNSISARLAYNIVQYFCGTASDNVIKIRYDGIDINDTGYYCATNPTDCGGCCPPDGSYGIYNILQFMYYMHTFGKEINPNFTLSKGLIIDEDLVTDISVCGVSSFTQVNVNLGIIDYGCSFYMYNDPYRNFYSTVISPQQMILSIDFSQIQNNQQWMIDASNNYGGIMFMNLWNCSYEDSSSSTCTISVEEALSSWTQLLCTNWNTPYYLNGICVECLTADNCQNQSTSYCVNNICVECDNNYNCNDKSSVTPYCITQNNNYTCSDNPCLDGWFGPECQCSSDPSNCNNQGTPIWDSSNNICACSCNSGWVGPQCQCDQTGSSPSTSNICSNNGLYVWQGDNTEGSCVCICNPDTGVNNDQQGWFGDNCQYTNTVCCVNNSPPNPEGCCYGQDVACTYTKPNDVNCNSDGTTAYYSGIVLQTCYGISGNDASSCSSFDNDNACCYTKSGSCNKDSNCYDPPLPPIN